MISQHVANVVTRREKGFTSEEAADTDATTEPPAITAGGPSGVTAARH